MFSAIRRAPAAHPYADAQFADQPADEPSCGATAWQRHEQSPD
jgi:hypothetical protein